MKKLSKKFNEWSQSNGCLMRITPLVLFCLKLSDEEIEKYLIIYAYIYFYILFVIN